MIILSFLVPLDESIGIVKAMLCSIFQHRQTILV
jgi:hypothetical protein